ncbi:MAG: PKD domain-containing protein [Flavobacterium sp.]|nr:PKD domain-containing protein [Flavobacterium sp.]
MKKILIFLLFCFVSFACKSQLVADFKTSNGVTGGCSPFSVGFLNTTKGASASATYTWDLGNGNTSSLQNPGANYSIEKTYTVVLTVTDNGKTSSKQLDITVYKKPTANFSIKDTKVCMPFTTVFTSASSAGDGTIKNFFWDFGDGSSTTVTAPTVTHTFTSSQSPHIVLVVTNSFGCQASVSKDTFITVNQAPVAAFTVSDNALCKLSDTVLFTNTTTGPGAIVYKWDFGDNSFATTKNASHVYMTKGVYNVTLTATSNLGVGCESIAKQIAPISAAFFNSKFLAPAIYCTNNSVNFIAANSITASSTQWQFSDDGFSTTFTGSNINKTFANAGSVIVRMINAYGKCIDTIQDTININASPKLAGFIINHSVVCSVPISVTFKDTSTQLVKRLWQLNGSDVLVDTTQNVTTIYQNEGDYVAQLKVTDNLGCFDTISKPFSLKIPRYPISVIATTSPTGLTGCPGFTVTFGAKPASDLVDYKWDFGDGSAIDVTANPSHTFTKEGVSKVTLNYVTKDGCSGLSSFLQDVIVYRKPVVDFSASDTVICGSNPFTLTDKSSLPATAWDWDFGDGTYWNGTSQTVTHKYFDSGYYNIKLITYNNTCSDTLEKKKYVYVLPLFADITSVINTCNGLRDSVWFVPKYRFVDSVTWRFGDGDSLISNPTVTTLLHQYKKTGEYIVGITISNNYCALRDSTLAYVLLKQSPTLTANADTICLSDSLKILVNTIENNPDAGQFYNLFKWEFGDGSLFTGSNTTNPPSFAFGNSFSDIFWNLKKGTQTIKAIIQSARFGCYDTTNLLTVTTKGPTAAFFTTNTQTCYKLPVTFSDTSSNGFNAPIVTRAWTFGDGTTAVKTDSTSFTHLYTTPASYNVQLRVTDAQGCYSIATNTAIPIQILGPKVNFNWNANPILTGTTVTFTNVTNSFGSTPNYQWNFSNSGLNSTAFGPINQSYASNATVDTVRLIATNTAIQCADTLVQIIPVKKIGLQFTHTTSYVNQSNCPPLVVSFETVLQRANTISWNFGDGTTAGNILTPTHTYAKPGVYTITLYGYGNNNFVDSVSDVIVVKGPYAYLTSNAVISCLPFTITLEAHTVNAASFIWDFGDGSLSSVQDTIASHQYLTPGIYQPVLIMKDSAGCSAAFGLPTTVLVDSLKLDITPSPMAICKAGVINFTNKVVSVSDGLNPASTAYHWVFGTGNAADTSNNASTLFNYTNVGKYPVTLQVSTASGCSKTVVDTVEVKPVAITTITSPASICEHDAATFTATSTIATNATYLWSFGNGNTANGLYPPPQTFTSVATPYNVALVSTYNGCNDTTFTTIKVLHNPVVNLVPNLTNICLGDSLLLTAHDGTIYQWQANAPSASNTFIVKPTIDTKYFVTVTNAVGCSSIDSAVITVSQPFNVSVLPDVILCLGSTTKLQASGADYYRWIFNTTGLSATNIANPLANPIVTTKYTVVGYDNAGCFTDTNSINVTLAPLPIANAGPDLLVGTGTSANLNGTGSSDVVSWLWSPANYLNCNTCQATITTPRTDITYTLTATTQYGCKASDAMNIKLNCIQSNLFIPSGFTPNNDPLNNVFYPLGKGIKNVRYFTIYNRTGEKIFERQGFNVNDKSAGWNGKIKGNEAASGVYIYVIEVECDTGDIFSEKGTVTLIR